MKNKKVLIIGAGIAGLSAGSYLERNGYDTELFELHSIPGGLCTAWRRGDYIFDYCIHWLMGTREGTGFDVIWDELKALEDEQGRPTEIRNFDEFTRVELSDGDILRFYSDADKLGEELMRIAPEDGKKIYKFIKELKQLARFKNAVNTEEWGIIKKIKFNLANARPFLKMIKYVRMTMEDFADRWESPKLREAFSIIIPSDWSALSLLMGMALQDIKAAGYPVGGSLTFARNIERAYLANGGQIHYSSKVEKILVKGDQAVGVRLDNGKEYYGDDIVSAADGYATLYKMLEGQYLPSKLEKAYQDYSLFPSSIYLGFGVKKDLSKLPHALTMYLPDPLELPDGSSHQYLGLNIYNFDPTLAPEGQTSVTVLINTWEDEYWRQLAKEDSAVYEKTKSRIAEEVLKIIDERIPGFSSSVEVIDVSTPHTVKRYTNNWHGSYEGFAPTPETLMKRLPKEVPGLKNCHMIGQWTEPGGGLPPAALDGRNLAIKLCKRDNKQFVAKRR